MMIDLIVEVGNVGANYMCNFLICSMLLRGRMEVIPAEPRGKQNPIGLRIKPIRASDMLFFGCTKRLNGPSRFIRNRIKDYRINWVKLRYGSESAFCFWD